ncbi:MAG: N-6 DNA methylase [candidate division WOR-3 bacterium]
MNRIGFVETPIELARLMVELSTVPKDAPVLDTGCGRGVFLQALREKGYKNVYGIELDKGLYDYCRQRFGEDFTIIAGDFLTYDFGQRFDLIIGNPPYVHFNRLPIKMANVVRDIIKTAEGDIYYAFIIRAISLLNWGGELIYIVPYHFFYNTYAKSVREALLRYGKIEIIIDLDEVRLFDKENPETVIFKFKKGKFLPSSERIKLLKVKTRKTNASEIYQKAIDSLKKGKSNELFDFHEIPHFLNPEPWSSFAFDIPEFPSVKLKDIAKVGVGLVSGFDEAFIIKGDVKLNPEELELVKRFVKAKNCKRFIVDGYENYILIDDTIRDENEFKSKYPNVYRKILPFKEKMLKRYLPKGKKWFQWQALRNYGFLRGNPNKKRIYVPTLDRKPYNRFSLGDENLLPAGDVLFIQPYNEEDLYFLLGYLNGEFFRMYYLSRGGRRGGRVSFTQKLLENSEIPLFSPDVKGKITQLTIEILSGLRENKNVSGFERELDGIINSAIMEERFSPLRIHNL